LLAEATAEVGACFALWSNTVIAPNARRSYPSRLHERGRSRRSPHERTIRVSVSD